MLSGFIALFAVLSITNALSLRTLCRTTFGRRRLGSRCTSFLLPCQVSPWSPWAQSPTKLEIDTSCRPSRSRGMKERKRTVTVSGPNCPSLCETRRANCLSSTTASAVNALRLYAALGANFNPAASVARAGPAFTVTSFKLFSRPGVLGRPGCTTKSRNAEKIAKEAEKLLGVVKRSYPQCSCPCASGLPQLSRDMAVVVDSSASINRTDFDKVKCALDKLLTNQCHFSSSCIGRDITRLALIAYSSHVHVVTNFKTFASSHATQNKLKTLIQSIPYLGGRARTGEALLKVKNKIFTASAGMRLNSKKSILLLTDYKSNGAKSNGAKSNGAINPCTVSKQIVSHSPCIDTIVIRQNVDVSGLERKTHHRNCLANILVADVENFVEIVEAIIALSGDCKFLQPIDIFDKR